MEERAIITIVVSGTNIMGQSLCSMSGIVLGKKKPREINYDGPVTSASELADAIVSLFIEVEG